MTRPQNTWQTGERMTGSTWSCPVCAAQGLESERRRQVVSVDFVNEARERAERAEAAARTFAPIVRHIAGMLDRFEHVQIPRQLILDARQALAAHPGWESE